MSLRRRHWLRWAIGAAAARPGAADAAAALQWRERALLGFGTTLWLRASHRDAATVERALDAVVAVLREVEQTMSLFRADSAICRLNREGLLRDPHPDLVAVLRLAATVAEASGGAFDATVQPLWALWQRAHREGRIPLPRERRAAMALVGWRGVRLEPRCIRLARPGMALTLNGIAQGFAADRAKATLRAHGIRDALLDTGEWQPLGRAADGQRWRLGVAHPRAADRLLATLVADGRALACSSDDKCSFSADHRHHHILDPRLGESPPTMATVLVAAHSCALADALTKVAFMGSVDDALALARRWPVDVLAFDKAGRLAATRWRG